MESRYSPKEELRLNNNLLMTRKAEERKNIRIFDKKKSENFDKKNAKI
jgi:hypothetical protein